MIGNRLKLARAAAGLSLRGLSGRINSLVTAQAIGKYERDESMPSSGVLIALADALHVSVGYLAGDPGMSLLSVDFRAKRAGTRQEEGSNEGNGAAHARALPGNRGDTWPS